MCAAEASGYGVAHQVGPDGSELPVAMLEENVDRYARELVQSPTERGGERLPFDDAAVVRELLEVRR